MGEERQRCCFDDWAGHDARRARRRGVTGVSAALAEALTREGLQGRTVLDVGCGVGALAMETLARGATRASGVDLSEGSIEEARTLAEERGLSERTAFEDGDGSRSPLRQHDVVVLDKVLCCFPDVDRLLDNSLAAAGSVYAMSVPASTGVRGWLNRRAFVLANLWFRLRASKFGGYRAFVHDVGPIDERVRRAGFRLAEEGSRRLIWHFAVYVRPTSPAGETA